LPPLTSGDSARKSFGALAQPRASCVLDRPRVPPFFRCVQNVDVFPGIIAKLVRWKSAELTLLLYSVAPSGRTPTHRPLPIRGRDTRRVKQCLQQPQNRRQICSIFPHKARAQPISHRTTTMSNIKHQKRGLVITAQRHLVSLRLLFSLFLFSSYGGGGADCCC